VVTVGMMAMTVMPVIVGGGERGLGDGTESSLLSLLFAEMMYSKYC
jgi:hypothetical protein